MDNKKIIMLIVSIMLVFTIISPLSAYAGIYNNSSFDDPEINIVTPEEGNLYVMGAQIFSLPFGLTILLGPVTVRADVSNGNGYDVEFWIDEVLEFTDPSEPFEYPWWDLSFGKHTIEVKISGTEISDSIDVIKII